MARLGIQEHRAQARRALKRGGLNQFLRDAIAPGELVNVDSEAKDGERFADSGGWGYTVFDYHAASDTFTLAEDLLGLIRFSGRLP